MALNLLILICLQGDATSLKRFFKNINISISNVTGVSEFLFTLLLTTIIKRTIQLQSE